MSPPGRGFRRRRPTTRRTYNDWQACYRSAWRSVSGAPARPLSVIRRAAWHTPTAISALPSRSAGQPVSRYPYRNSVVLPCPAGTRYEPAPRRRPKPALPPEPEQKNDISGSRESREPPSSTDPRRNSSNGHRRYGQCPRRSERRSPNCRHPAGSRTADPRRTHYPNPG